MSIFIRVSDKADDHGTLYDNRFKRAHDVEPQPGDLLISATSAFWRTIKDASPTHLVIRVHEDKFNQNPREGRFYDDTLRELDVFSRVSVMEYGSPVVFTVTPDELQVVLDARG